VKPGLLITWLIVLALAVGFVDAQVSLPTPSGTLNPKVPLEAREIGRYGGTLVVAQLGDPRTFNPIVAQETSSTDVLRPMFDGLLEQNYISGELEPALAETWTVSVDGRAWTFTLREGVQWSDGSPLTIDDVLFTLDAVFTDGVQTALRDPLMIDGKSIRYRKLDDRRVQFTTERPAGLFLRLIATLPIVPKHKLAAALGKGGTEFNKAWDVHSDLSEIVGTGPFVLDSYVAGERVTYLRNGRHWKVDGKGNRLPYLTRYVRLVVPTQDTQRLKFLAKETDLYTARPREFADLKRSERTGNYSVQDGPEALGAEFLVLNQNPAAVTPPKLTWFQDVQFRRAINYAINRGAIVQQVYAGRATPAWGPLSPADKPYVYPNLPQSPYDLNRALQLLAEAGYQKDPDGLLRDARGEIVEFVLSTSLGNPEREAIGNILRQDFTSLGIRVAFSPEGLNTLIGKLVGTHRWEAMIIGLAGAIEPAVGSRNVWMSSGALHMWHPEQEKPATDWEAEVDRLFDEIGREVDPGKRTQLYYRWQEIIALQMPLMFFAYPKTQTAVRNTLGNVKPGLNGAIGELATLYSKSSSR